MDENQLIWVAPITMNVLAWGFVGWVWQRNRISSWWLKKRYTKMKYRWGERLFVAPGREGEVIVAYPAVNKYLLETFTGEPISDSIWVAEQKSFCSLDDALSYAKRCEIERMERVAELNKLQDLHQHYLETSTFHLGA